METFRFEHTDSQVMEYLLRDLTAIPARNDAEIESFINDVIRHDIIPQMFYSTELEPFVKYLFEPSALSTYGYNVFFCKGCESDGMTRCGTYSTTFTEASVCEVPWPHRSPPVVAEMRENQTFDISSNCGRSSKDLYISELKTRKMRRLIFPSIEMFVQQEGMKIFHSKSSCLVLSIVVAWCRAEDTQGTFVSHVAQSLARVNIFLPPENSGLNSEGALTIIKQNLKHDAVMFRNMCNLFTTEAELSASLQLFAVYFIEELSLQGHLQLYLQSSRGMEIVRLLEETQIPRVLSYIPQDK